MEIYTDRVMLRRFKHDDINDFFEHASNPNIGPNAGWAPHKDVDTTKEILEKFIECDGEFAIVYRETGKVIGSFGYNNDAGRKAENAKIIGYCLSEDYWGKGLMTEIVNRMIVYAFDESDCTVLSVRHFPFNERSQKVIEKCGFTFEGRMRHSFQMYNGEVHDDMCYSILRTEYFLKKLANAIK